MFANENTLFERVNVLGIFMLNETGLRYGYKLGSCQLERNLLVKRVLGRQSDKC